MILGVGVRKSTATAEGSWTARNKTTGRMVVFHFVTWRTHHFLKYNIVLWFSHTLALFSVSQCEWGLSSFSSTSITLPDFIHGQGIVQNAYFLSASPIRHIQTWWVFYSFTKNIFPVQTNFSSSYINLYTNKYFF